MSRSPYISVKWPGLLVMGEPVTKEQAAEILVRTNIWPCMSNNRDVDAIFNKIAGMPVEPEYNSPDHPKWYDSVQETCDKLGVLTLAYLTNDRITTCYAGGPYGWCDWEGNIGASSYNIGKWPNTDEVTTDLKYIAEAFPYLKMDVQVLSGETCEEIELVPTAQWRVRNGKVTLLENTPKTKITNITDTNFAHWNDVGATTEQVKLGVELANARGKVV